MKKITILRECYFNNRTHAVGDTVEASDDTAKRMVLDQCAHYSDEKPAKSFKDPKNFGEPKGPHGEYHNAMLPEREFPDPEDTEEVKAIRKAHEAKPEEVEVAAFEPHVEKATLPHPKKK